MSKLHNEIQKLANNKPEFRGLLIPLLKAAKTYDFEEGTPTGTNVDMWAEYKPTLKRQVMLMEKLGLKYIKFQRHGTLPLMFRYKKWNVEISALRLFELRKVKGLGAFGSRFGKIEKLIEDEIQAIKAAGGPRKYAPFFDNYRAKVKAIMGGAKTMNLALSFVTELIREMGVRIWT